MAKPLYQQFQEMEGVVEFPDFQLLLAWARKEGYDGTQKVARIDRHQPWGEDNCELKPDGARPVQKRHEPVEAAPKKTRGKKKAEAPATEEPATEEPATEEPATEEPASDADAAAAVAAAL